MSNTDTFKDFYQVPDLTFNISKLRLDLEKNFKKIKISNTWYYKLLQLFL